MRQLVARALRVGADPSDDEDRRLRKVLLLSAAYLIAAAGAKGLDSCGGDSGGPLFATTGGGTRIQMGVVSFGIGCAKQHFPGVYAEVNSPTIRSFIQTVAGV
jgi:hypothetical protein